MRCQHLVFCGGGYKARGSGLVLVACSAYAAFSAAPHNQMRLLALRMCVQAYGVSRFNAYQVATELPPGVPGTYKMFERYPGKGWVGIPALAVRAGFFILNAYKAL